MNNKEQGSVLIVVLLLSSLLAVIVLFSWEFAVLQNKMAYNYSAEALERIKAQASLEHRIYSLCDIEFIQFVPDTPLSSESSGLEYYRVHSDPYLKVKLQATIAIRRTKNGAIQEIKKKTWEEVRD